VTGEVAPISVSNHAQVWQNTFRCALTLSKTPTVDHAEYRCGYLPPDDPRLGPLVDIPAEVTALDGAVSDGYEGFLAPETFRRASVGASLR
jgi:hypothetical protein